MQRISREPEQDETDGTGAGALSGRLKIVVVAILAAGALLRFVAATDQMWLDEVWSVVIAQQAESPLALVTGNENANNHPLNSLWIRALGFDGGWVGYRMLSVFSGIAMLLVLWTLPIGAGVASRLAVVCLTAFSYPMILYSAEARGYMPAMCFAVSVYALGRGMSVRPGFGQVAGMAALVILGFLAHLTFVYFYLSFFVWTALRQWRELGATPAAVVNLARLHGILAAFCAWYYLVFVREMINPGGAEVAWTRTLVDTFALSLGGPDQGAAGWLSVLAGAALIGWGIRELHRRGDDEWLFYLGVLLAAPLAILAVRREGWVYFRYFLVCFPFLYLLAGMAVERLWTSKRNGGAAAVGALAILLAFHSVRTANLISIGRGAHIEALQHIVDESPAGPIVVGTDHDFRNKLLMGFYVPHVNGAERLVYRDFAGWPPGGVDWAITHKMGKGVQPKDEISRDGVRYALDGEFRYDGGYSGFHWFLYRRMPQGAAAE